MAGQMLAFQGGRSTTLVVTAANATVVIPAGYNTLMVSTMGVTGDDFIWSTAATTAVPAAGTFSAGTIVQRATAQTFAIDGQAGTYSFTPFGAGGTIGLTLGHGS